MKRFSRDTWLALVLFFILTIVTAVAVYQEAQNAIDQPDLAAFSDEPEGAKALFLYLNEIGFVADDSVQTEFEIPNDTDVMLLLEPFFGMADTEWEQIDEWVRDGGTLIISGSNLGTLVAFDRYNTRLRGNPLQDLSVSLQNPLMVSPAIPVSTTLENEFILVTDRENILIHLASSEDGQPVIISFQQGSGRVVLSAMPQVFTNQGLAEPGHAEIALNLITAGGEVQNIWFDEWHHGIRPTIDSTGGRNWLQGTPVGRAILYLALVLFIGLILRGRIFGRPVPLQKELHRRAPLEYISGIANLSRRAGNRTAVLEDYHGRLKRTIGHRYRVNPSLPDNEFIQQLSAYDSDLDEEALRSLLNRLSQKNVSEDDLVEMAAEAVAFGQSP